MTGNQRRNIALLSVSDKRGISGLARWLSDKCNLELVASGGTAEHLRKDEIMVTDVSNVTHFEEMFDGRVKTLHPALHAGILARADSEFAQLDKFGYPLVKVVVCNLYPFEKYMRDTESNYVNMDHIDIGGVALLRAGAKNHQRVLTICEPKDYAQFIEKSAGLDDVSEDQRRMMARKVFSLTVSYDGMIEDYMRKSYFPEVSQYNLRYGMNPHQIPAQIWTNRPSLPFSVISGSPGYINMCDALNAYQLVRELSEVAGLPAATSFKHLSPAGAAVGIELDPVERRVCMVDDLNHLTPLACAYARARGADRLSSFGDFIALSHECDESTARIISREVSDGIIAPSYSPKAKEILQKKKKGRYLMLTVNSDYRPTTVERRNLFGVTLEQPKNDAKISLEDLKKNIRSNTTGEISEDVIIDLLVAAVAVKYTQSNSVVIANRGQVIGVGAGQQSRIHCTRLAAEKASKWMLRHMPKVLNLVFKEEVDRLAKVNLVDNYVGGTVGIDISEENFNTYFTSPPEALTNVEKREWCVMKKNLTLASDAYFPFRDSIDRALHTGVKYIFAPKGSKYDDIIMKAIQERDMIFIESKYRLFHH